MNITRTRTAHAPTIRPMTFQGFLAVPQGRKQPCPNCHTPIPCHLICPHCECVFCASGCRPAQQLREPITCPACGRYADPEREAQRLAQMQQQAHQRANGTPDTPWWWSHLMGRPMAKTTVPADRVLEHIPLRGTIIQVLDHHGNRSQQETTGGTAQRNGDQIELLVDVTPCQ